MSDFVLQISAALDWADVDHYRDGVRSLLQPVVGKSLAEALSMAACELLENAVKYRDPASPTVDLTVSVAPAGSAVITVTNATDDEHHAILRSHCALLDSFEDRGGAYRSILGKLLEAPNPFAPGTSRLGLARIVSEAKCDLTVVGSEPRRVTVRAECAMPRGAPCNSSV